LLVDACDWLVEAACSERALACQAQHGNRLDYGALLQVISATERMQLTFLEQLRGCLEGKARGYYGAGVGQGLLNELRDTSTSKGVTTHLCLVLLMLLRFPGARPGPSCTCPAWLARCTACHAASMPRSSGTWSNHSLIPPPCAAELRCAPVVLEPSPPLPPFQPPSAAPSLQPKPQLGAAHLVPGFHGQGDLASLNQAGQVLQLALQQRAALAQEYEQVGCLLRARLPVAAWTAACAAALSSCRAHGCCWW
jgi:hypothetical protein